MRFKIVEIVSNEIVHGFQDLDLSNPYVSAYPSVQGRAIKDLAVGEKVEATYSLSGQKKTTYYIVRTA